MFKYKTKNKNGFTLTEVMVSMFILAIVIAGFLPIFTLSIANIYNAGQRTKEVFSTQQMLEKAFSDENTSVTKASIQISFDNSTNLEDIHIEGKDISSSSINMFLPHN